MSQRFLRLFVSSIDACKPPLPLAIAVPLPRRLPGMATAKQQRKRDWRHAEQNGPPTAPQFLSEAQPHSQTQRRNISKREISFFLAGGQQNPSSGEMDAISNQ